VNNLAMLWVVAPALERLLVAPERLLALFFACGAGGWLASLAFARCAHPEMWRMGVAQHQTSNGSSPATYALAVMAAAAAGAAGAAGEAGEEIVVGAAVSGVPPWVAFFAVFVLPKCFSDKWGMRLVGGGVPAARAVALACFCAGAGAVAGPVLVGPSPSGTTFLVMYFTRIVVDQCLGALFFGRDFFGVGSDNAAHLGGALCGAAAARVLFGVGAGPGSWGVGLRLCFAFLAARVGHDWAGGPFLSTAKVLVAATVVWAIAVPFIFQATELRAAAYMFLFYTFLLFAPSTPLRPTKWVILLSFVCTVVFPVLGAVAVVALHAPFDGGDNNKSVSVDNSKYPPAWNPATHGTTGANHNFCEEDHTFSSWIAEFHNSWSSLPIIFYGGVGPYYTRRYATKELRFSAGFVSIGAVGVGSTLYHATLLRVGQILDEVPMLCIIFAGIFCFVEDRRESKYGPWFPALLVTTCLGLVAGYLVFYLHILFVLAFGLGVVGLIARGVVVVRKASKLSARVLIGAAAAIAFGFTCWITDEQLCAYVIRFRLHIFWHLGTGLAGYLFTMFLLTLRAEALGKRASLVVSGWDGNGWRLSEELVWSRVKRGRPEFLLPFVEFVEEQQVTVTVSSDKGES
jgi:dihydroceramidase